MIKLEMGPAARQPGNYQFFTVSTRELGDFARLTGHGNIHDISVYDLNTTHSKIPNHTASEHV